MKKIIKVIISLVSIFIFTYSVWGFVLNTYNATEWTEQARGYMIITYCAFAFIYFLASGLDTLKQ